MKQVISQMLSLLTPAERHYAFGCCAAMFFMAIVDVIGVASIMPFIAVIADPEAIQHHSKLAWLYNHWHFTSTHSFLIFLGLLVLAILVIGNALSMVTTYITLRFTYAREYSLAQRLFIRYLYQPYLFFLNRHSSELSKNILTEIATVINRAFIPCMQLIAKSIVSVLVVMLLLFVDPVLAFVITVILGGAYMGIYLKARKKLTIISRRCLEDNRQKYKITAEALGGIKDIKLLGKEDYFIKRFSFYAKQHAEDEAHANIIAQLPRFALETIAFGGVLLIIIYLLVMEKNIANALPLLALYAFASLRLMPALQQIFTSIAFLRVSKEALTTLCRDLTALKLSVLPESGTSKHTPQLNFNKQLTLREVSFNYPQSQRSVVQAINLTIPVNSTIGFVGMTGAGKTTVVDLILGLLTPTQGEIIVDDVVLADDTIASWQKKIGYVPQSIFLSDDSVINNIAFGVPETEIDPEAVERAAKMANIHAFICDELDQGYETIVGDRGLRLSGGQRQRIGIARALYHNPDILVMDEATNALDNLTESGIMEAIKPLTHKKTLIIIAHKLSTLQACDQIYLFEGGKLYASGKYAELIKLNEKFRALAGSQ